MSSSHPQQSSEDRWLLRLYIAGNTSRSKAAEQNLRRLCDERLNGNYSLEIVDLLAEPDLAERHRIFAVPTLVRENPEPRRKIIGDLSNEQQVLTGLGLPR
ncbi:MAG: circadian clock KaiB family protein [Limisphaerales bacterium]